MPAIAVATLLDLRVAARGLGDRLFDQRRGVARGLRRALREVADFVGDDREAHARLAGARRFNGRVQREDVGLERDLIDGLDDLRDLLARLLDRRPSTRTMSPSAWFAALDLARRLRPSATPAVCEFSAFWRVIDAISSIDAEVSSSDAACSVAPCDSDCAEVDTWPAAEAVPCAACVSCDVSGDHLATRAADDPHHAGGDHEEQLATPISRLGDLDADRRPDCAVRAQRRRPAGAPPACRCRPSGRDPGP